MIVKLFKYFREAYNKAEYYKPTKICYNEMNERYDTKLYAGYKGKEFTGYYFKTDEIFEGKWCFHQVDYMEGESKDEEYREEYGYSYD